MDPGFMYVPAITKARAPLEHAPPGPARCSRPRRQHRPR